MPNAEMKTLTIGDTTYEIVDEEAREKEGDLSELNTQVQTDLVAAINEVAESSGVVSVNGMTGTVVLTAADVGAATTGALTDEATARTAADAQLQGQITALGNGAPIPVSTIAAMTVQTQVYLYTGTETGESTGYWYTYDSTQAKFVPRGEYGGAVTDTTLSISGRPADAKAVGDEIADLKSAINENINVIKHPVTIDIGTSRYVSNGTLITGTNVSSRASIAPFVPVTTKIGVYLAKNYWFTLSGSVNGTWSNLYTSETDSGVYSIDSNVTEISFQFGLNSQGVIPQDDAPAIIAFCEISESVSNIKSNIKVSTDKLSGNINNQSLWVIGGLGASGEHYAKRNTSIMTQKYLSLDTLLSLVTNNSFTTGYVALYTDSAFVVRIAITSNTVYSVMDLLRSYPTATRMRVEIGDVSGSLSCYNYVSLIGFPATAQNIIGLESGKQNRHCNNLIGTVFERLYAVESLITEGTVLTFSTSDGQQIGGALQTNIGFYDVNRHFLGYFGFPLALSTRTVTVDAQVANAKYLAIINAEPRVPIMINYGNEALPYEEYFESAPTLTEKTNNIEERLNVVEEEAINKDLFSQSKYVYSATDSGAGTEKTLTLLHFTDVHGNKAGMDYALALYDKYSDSIDDIIHTGDTVTANLSDGITNWINSGCAEKVLNVIGNHDTEENLVLQAAGKDNVYNTIFAPYISGWGVTQPTGVGDSTSGDYHALYYYKDYAEAKVRLIVCDTNFWDNAQKTWLISALAGAKTLDYAVVLACHDVKKLTELTTANFSSYNGDGINEGNSYANQPDNWLDPVKDFMDDGGHFVCILAGHNHNGHMGYMTYYPDIFVYVAQKSSMNRVSGTARILGESNQNTVSIVTINPTEKLFKLFSIGAQVDGHLRQRHVFCYNYETKTIISQW